MSEQPPPTEADVPTQVVTADAAAQDQRYAHVGTRDASRITSKAVGSGLAWTLGGQWAAYAVQVVSGVVLARLVSPSDFGIYGMALTITVFATRLQSLGLGQAVVQRPNITHGQLSSLFWFTVAVGTFLAAAVAATSPLVAAFYGHSELIPMLGTMSATFVLGGSVVIHNALLARHLLFRRMALRSLGPQVIGAAFGITVAALHGGYWALVIMQLTGALATTVLLWTAVDWRPGLPRRRTGVRQLIRFGAGISVANFLSYFAGNLDNILIGRYLGAAPLGLYSRAYNLFYAPMRQIHGPLSNVAQPVMATLMDEPPRYRSFYRHMVWALALFGMPGVVYLAVMSPEVIDTLLGPRWVGAAQVFRWLAIAGFIEMITRTFTWLFVTSGRARALAIWSMISSPTYVVAFIIGVHWGINGVAAGFAITSLLLTPFAFRYALQRTPVTVSDMLGTTWRPAIIALGVGAATIATRAAIEPIAQWLAVAGTGAAAVACWSVLVWLWPPVRHEFQELRNAVLHRLHK